MESKKKDLSIYIHIPFCKKKCIYCDFLSFGECEPDRQRQYIDALCGELEAYRTVAKGYVVRTVFIGGGTPSYIEALWIEQIMQTLFRIFLVDADAEITIEGNPDSLTWDKVWRYKAIGINRLSIGLQSTSDEMLGRLGRVHDYSQFIKAYQNARTAGFTNVNIDIMSGLPGESEESYMQTLKKVVALKPEHISAYSLIVEEGTLLSQNEALLQSLPTEEMDRLLYVRTKELLLKNGYNRYEISNYAREGFSCRHNTVYWTGGEYLGVGLGAASYLTLPDHENSFSKVRFHGVRNPDEYINRFSKSEFVNFNFSDSGNVPVKWMTDYYEEVSVLSRKEEMEEFMFLGLRRMQGVSVRDFEERFGVTLQSVYKDAIEQYTQMGLLIEKEDRIFFSDRGIDVSNIVMAEFIL